MTTMRAKMMVQSVIENMGIDMATNQPAKGSERLIFAAVGPSRA